MSMQDKFDALSGPYCVCCGSRNVMTTERRIKQELGLPEQTYHMRLQRVWDALDALVGDEFSDRYMEISKKPPTVDFVDAAEAILKIGGAHSLDPSIEEQTSVSQPPCFIKLTDTQPLERKPLLEERKEALYRLFGEIDHRSKKDFAHTVLQAIKVGESARDGGTEC